MVLYMQQHVATKNRKQGFVNKKKYMKHAHSNTDRNETQDTNIVLRLVGCVFRYLCSNVVMYAYAYRDGAW